MALKPNQPCIILLPSPSMGEGPGFGGEACPSPLAGFEAVAAGDRLTKSGEAEMGGPEGVG